MTDLSTIGRRVATAPKDLTKNKVIVPSSEIERGMLATAIAIDLDEIAGNART
jgi:hypothetical protein